jgi:hypothetical protein
LKVAFFWIYNFTKILGLGFLGGSGMFFRAKIVSVYFFVFYSLSASNVLGDFADQDVSAFRFAMNLLSKGKGVFRRWEKDLRNDYPHLLSRASAVDLAKFFNFIVNLSSANNSLRGVEGFGKFGGAAFFDCLLWKALDSDEEKIRIAESLVCLCMCYDCVEASFVNRIRFVFYVLQDIVRKYPDPTARLVYTSFSSGGLLQDLMIIYGMIFLGYNNIELNFIDRCYVETNSEFLNCRDAFKPLIYFYVEKFKKKIDYNFKLNLNGSPNYFKSVYQYFEQYGSLGVGNIFVTVDWGQVPIYEIGDMLDCSTGPVEDVSKTYFLGFCKSILHPDSACISDFYVRVPQSGPLSFVWAKVKTGELFFLLNILNECQSKVSSFIGKDDFVVRFTECLNRDYFAEIRKHFRHVFYEASTSFEWGLLIEKAGIPDKDKLVVYQLTRNIITPGVNDDSNPLFSYLTMWGHIPLAKGEVWEKILLTKGFSIPH